VVRARGPGKADDPAVPDLTYVKALPALVPLGLHEWRLGYVAFGHG
jgi:hypothetical protein